jgi:hypothetical protein
LVYLKVAIYVQNVGGNDNSNCWFGRILLSTNNNGTAPATPGGIIQIITDYRNPSTATSNYINVKQKWDGSGNNTLWIEINSFTFAGNIRVKIS